MKTIARSARHRRVRSRISGTADRPRLVVFRGTKTLSAQLIDDATGTVLLAVTNAGTKGAAANVEAATALGTEVAKQAKAKKLSAAVFDRAGYRYHGAVKAICEAAREGGVRI
ncbi:MAG: 50S ribosomal protein L18 [Patescibacteria group bacterium]